MKGVLVDLDGTLIDSNEAHARAWMEALADAGIPAEFAALKEWAGKRADRLLPGLTGIDPQSELGQRIQDRRAEIFRIDFLPMIRAFPGATALLQLFRDRGFRMAALTASPLGHVDMLLKQTKLEGYLEGAMAESVSAGLRKLAVPARDVIFVGDTPSDVEAARRAGVRSIAFTSGGWSAEQLSGANAIYQGPWDLLAEFEGSLFGTREKAA